MKRAACIVIGLIAAVTGGLVFLMFATVLLLVIGLGGDVDPAGLAEVIAGAIVSGALTAWGLWLIVRGGRRQAAPEATQQGVPSAR